MVDAIGDRETIDFVRRQAQDAKYVTSVCTGAFILGAAGLLQGTARHHALGLHGSPASRRRDLREGQVVKDGNLITAGGVTSGIDFGLSVVAEIAGETAARTIQLGIEYDPAPPFDSGHPDRAGAALTETLVARRYGKLAAAYRDGLAGIAVHRAA